jgi:hypothetical protein
LMCLCNVVLLLLFWGVYVFLKYMATINKT